jgi:hypothetical protein
MIDGLADVNIPALGFKTPLQVHAFDPYRSSC